MGRKLVAIDIMPLKATILAHVPHKGDRERIMGGIAKGAMDKWMRLAQQRLRSTSRDYVAGLQSERKGSKLVMSLNGRVPNMVEQGWDGGDMRDWMLQSKKVKRGKNGPYLVIPFRHGTPGTTGRNVGPQMPGPIHNAASQLTATVSRPGKAVSHQGGKTTVWGQRLHPGMTSNEQAKAILGRKEKPWHTTSIYMGMVHKAQMTKKGPSTSGYQTFRTISMHSNMPGKHWVHPGIKARHLAKEVHKYIEKIAAGIVASASGHKK